MSSISTNDLDKLAKHNVLIKDGITMTVGQANRWILLLEALEYIEIAHEDRDERFNIEDIANYAKKHKAITTFINDRYYAGLYDNFKKMSVN